MDRLFVYLASMTSSVSYLIIFGILLACGLGFPLPEDIPLIAAGYLVWGGTMEWAAALGVTVGGVLLGDTALFFIGRKLGLHILDRPAGKKPLFKPAKVRRTRAYFRKYGDKLIFFARFVAGFRAVCFFMAGALGVPYSKFILFDGVAALLSVPAWLGVGYGMGHYLGDEIEAILVAMKDFKVAAMVVTLIVLALLLVHLLKKFGKAKEARRTTSEGSDPAN